MQSIKNIKNLKNKKVLVRVDFNVPIKNGKVMDDFRIKKAIPTIQFILKKGANKIILITHLGKDGSASLEPVVKHFFKLSKFPKSKIEFFENIRKYEEEENNDKNFAKKLAQMADIYVNEAFSVSHRKHTSLVSIPKFLPSYAGLQLENEVENLKKALQNTPKPLLVILGGAKFGTKLPLIKKYLPKADFIFVGGALSNDLLYKRGYNVGKSLVSQNVSVPKDILNNFKIVSPIEVLLKDGNKYSVRRINQVKDAEEVIDIAGNSISLLKAHIDKAEFILWNGPLGKYEDRGDKGTKETMKHLLNSKKEVVIGGGDLVSVFNSLNKNKKINNKKIFLSTGGGATLEFLTKGTLPGIEALR